MKMIMKNTRAADPRVAHEGPQGIYSLGEINQSYSDLSAGTIVRRTVALGDADR